LGLEFSRPAALWARQSGLPKKFKTKTTRTAAGSLRIGRKKCREEFKCNQPIFPIFSFQANPKLRAHLSIDVGKVIFNGESELFCHVGKKATAIPESCRNLECKMNKIASDSKNVTQISRTARTLLNDFQIFDNLAARSEVRQENLVGNPTVVTSVCWFDRSRVIYKELA